MSPDQLALPTAHLIVEAPGRTPGGLTEFACRLELPQASQRLRFRYPPESARLLTLRAGPFVIATALFARDRMSRMRIHGAVSDGLLANIVDFQAACAACRGRGPIPPVEYTASMTPEPSLRARPPLGLTAFSGGVDSCFSVFRHTGLLDDLVSRNGSGLHEFAYPLDAAEAPGALTPWIAGARRRLRRNRRHQRRRRQGRALAGLVPTRLRGLRRASGDRGLLQDRAAPPPPHRPAPSASTT